MSYRFVFFWFFSFSFKVRLVFLLRKIIPPRYGKNVKESICKKKDPLVKKETVLVKKRTLVKKNTSTVNLSFCLQQNFFLQFFPHSTLQIFPETILVKKKPHNIGKSTILTLMGKGLYHHPW